MTRFRFAGLDPNAQIFAVGPLIKRHHQKKWMITLQFKPHQSKSELSLSHAPRLYRKALLNQERERKQGGWKQTVSVQESDGWDICRVRDCPIYGFSDRVDRDQFCFVFKILDGTTVFLPQFELARVLFYYDSYFSRTSIVPTGLSLEFDVNFHASHMSAQINVLSSSGYSLGHFNDPRNRMILGWILLDPDARRSYESIGRIQLKEGIDTEQYRLWHFRFNPPNLSGADLHVRGRYDQRTKALFVYEIDAIKNLKAEVPEEIVFCHPEFTHPVCSGGLGTGFSQLPPPEALEIEDECQANVDTTTMILRRQGVLVEFDKQFYTSKQTETIKAASYGRIEEGGAGAGELTVSMEEAIQGGRLARADWGNDGDALDCGILFENKFKCFSMMIDELVSQHGCRLLGQRTRRLRQVGKSSKHQFCDGKSRCIATVSIQQGEKEFRLIEVDTSDGRDSISTLLIRVIEPSSWDMDYNGLEYGLVKSGLRWPKEHLSRICGSEGFCGISHPKTVSGDKGALEADSVGGWAARVYSKMERL